MVGLTASSSATNSMPPRLQRRWPGSPPFHHRGSPLCVASAATDPNFGIGYGSSPSRCKPDRLLRLVRRGISRFPGNELPHMPGSSTTPGRPGTRAHAPVCVAFHLRNSVGTRDINLYGAQWLAYVLPYRRFAAALTGDYARLRANVDRYSFIASDLHRLLVAGLPAHCEGFWTSNEQSPAGNTQQK